MDNTEQLIISLCPGIRGLERGIERVTPIRAVAYVEIEAFLIENLVCEMEAGLLAPTPVWTNVKTFDARPFRGKVHGITGGYPCQPFSVAGKRGGEDDSRHLWPYIGKGEGSIVGTVRPLWVFFENVSGHLSLGYEEVRRDLQGLGYKVEEGIFSAEEVGAPHQRKRLFILGVREEVDNASGNRLEQKYKISASGNSAEYDGQLANTDLNGERTQPRETASESGETEGEEQWQERDEVQRKRMWSESGNESRNGVVADSSKLRIQRERAKGEQEPDSQTGEELFGCNGRRDRWPARPGERQYDWEYPRTITTEAEPDMGISVNGFRFREDLLRSLGNAVVPDTAELAWETLWRKI